MHDLTARVDDDEPLRVSAAVTVLPGPAAGAPGPGVPPVVAGGVPPGAYAVDLEHDGLARRFTALVRACGVAGRRESGAPVQPGAELDAWLAEARTCGIGAVETFAAGLDVDAAAVRAALTETWSSGQAEGQVNRLKLLKRQSYGRAGFDLLRRRVLLAA